MSFRIEVTAVKESPQERPKIIVEEQLRSQRLKITAGMEKATIKHFEEGMKDCCGHLMVLIKKQKSFTNVFTI